MRIEIKTSSLVIAVLFFLLLCACETNRVQLISSNDDPYTGVWVLQESEGAIPRGTSQKLTIQVVENYEIYRSELIVPEGKRQVTFYAAPYDGVEQPSNTVVVEANGNVAWNEGFVRVRKNSHLVRERYWKNDDGKIRLLRRSLTRGLDEMHSQVVEFDNHGNENVVGTLVFRREKVDGWGRK